MAAILHIRDLTKQFGGLTAVDAVSFGVPEGGIVGLIGPNGAGKTTIFNLITGVYRPTSGSIEFGDRSIVGLEPFRIADMGITRTFQNIRLFKNLSVFDNVLTACHLNANYSFADAILRLPRFRAQEKGLMAKAENLLGIMGLWLQGPEREQSALRAPAQARDRAGPGAQPYAPSARRACGGHEP